MKTRHRILAVATTLAFFAAVTHCHIAPPKQTADCATCHFLQTTPFETQSTPEIKPVVADLGDVVFEFSEIPTLPASFHPPTRAPPIPS